jgi:Fic family protein
MKLPQTPPRAIDYFAALHVLENANPGILESFSATVGDRYVHWDGLRRRTPPANLTSQQWWALIKLARSSLYRSVPLTDSTGTSFRYAMPDPLQQMLSEADRDLSGRVAVPDLIRNEGTRDRFIVSALIEESVTSSQLEGASTTRKVATEMLRSGRRPRDLSERMIFNNFAAMNFIRSVSKQPLTPDLVIEIHRRVMEDTLEDPGDAGRLRTTDDVRVHSPEGDELHRPPVAAELPVRLKGLCAFANGATPAQFVHPILRAVLLHFGLAYDHPFVDGNGRTARAVFYWSLLHANYWLGEFISISSILRKAPSKYARAFLYSETDENDLTYFALYQMEVLHRAIRAAHDYVREKAEALKSTQSLLQQSQSLNHRQLALLAHALGNSDAQFAPTSHAQSHQVTRQTARADLKELVRLGLLVPMKVRNGFAYLPPPNLDHRVAGLGRGRE